MPETIAITKAITNLNEAQEKFNRMNYMMLCERSSELLICMQTGDRLDSRERD